MGVEVMSDRTKKTNEAMGQGRTGRRRFVDMGISPRNKTVCFMVSEEEKEAIDQIGFVLGRTRSAMLTQIVTGFTGAVFDADNFDERSKELVAYLEECRELIRTKPYPNKTNK